MITVIGKSNDAELLASCLKCGMNNPRADVGIRYGVQEEDIRPAISINTPRALDNARHKYWSLVMFAEAGLPTPKFSLECYDLAFPLLGRKFHHWGGRDIVMFKNKDQVKEMDYYIEFLPIDEEYRFHVVCGEIVSSSIKVGGDKRSTCRNLNSGWTFKETKKFLLPELPDLSMWAIRALGLHFGAVDIMVSKGKPYLLEINTAPGLIERRAKLYAKKLNQYITQHYKKIKEIGM